MRRRFVVSGQVQGVGFRWFVLRQARTLGLTGFVRNLPDGRVEIVACGDGASVGALEAELRRGPPSAYVAGVVEEENPRGAEGLTTFEVR